MSKRLWRHWLAAVLAAAVLLSTPLALAGMARAAGSDEIRTQIQALEAEHSAMQAELEALEQQKKDNLTQIGDVVAQKLRVDQQIQLLAQQIDNTNQRIAAYNTLIADRQEELDAAEARQEALREKSRERIRAMEEESGLNYWSVLFKAKSFADLLDRLDMIEEIAAADRRRLDELNRAAEAVRSAREALLAGKAELNDTKAALDASKAEQQARRQEADALMQELLSRGEEYRALLESTEEAEEALLQEIARQEALYSEAKQEEYLQWLSTSTPAQTQPEDETPEAANPGGWVIPCSYVYVSSPFNPNRLHPILGYVRPHRGIDLAAYLGTPVYATRGGTVTTASVGSEEGNYVVINHGDGYASVYMHLDYYTVSPGEAVAAGEQIGVVGSSGLSDGPHLHFGIMYQGTYVNPADYMAF